MVIIENTIRSDARAAAPARRRSRAATALAGGVLGAIVVALALPQAVSWQLALPGDPVIAAIRAGAPVAEDRFTRLIDSREAALAWWDDGALWHDLGRAHLARALSLPYSRAEDRLAELERARLALREAAARRPLDSRAWLRLSLTELLLLRRDASAQALEMAMQAAPTESSQFGPRIEYGLKLWDRLSPEGRQLWQQQVRLQWRGDRPATARLIRRFGNRERFEAALAFDPAAREALDALLRR